MINSSELSSADYGLSIVSKNVKLHNVTMYTDTSYIKANIHEVQKRIVTACVRVKRSPDEVKLVAISKGINTPFIEAAYNTGLRNFGENRIQEATQKISKLSGMDGITWHLVGHLQTNKVKIAVETFHTIHSVNSVRLADLISQQVFQSDRVQSDFPILLQVNITGEVSKQGFSAQEVVSAFKTIARLPHIKIEGLMTIAPLTNNPENVRPVFNKLRQLRDDFGVHELSMGMTDDFEIAIEEGATIIRIGRAIFNPSI